MASFLDGLSTALANPKLQQTLIGMGSGMAGAASQPGATFGGSLAPGFQGGMQAANQYEAMNMAKQDQVLRQMAQAEALMARRQRQKMEEDKLKRQQEIEQRRQQYLQTQSPEIQGLAAAYPDQAGRLLFEQMRPERGPQSVVNVQTGEQGPQFGTIPSGYMMQQGEDGRWQMQPVPGGPAEQEMQAEQERKQTQQQTRNVRADVMLRDTNRALDLIEQGGFPAAGPVGGTAAFIPGTPGYNLDKILDSVRANIGFDALTKMRAESPTGGALGQVSEMENRLLQSTLGSLDLRQDPERLAENLRTIQQLQLNAYYGSPEELKAAVEAGRMDQAQAINSRGAALEAMGMSREQVMQQLRQEFGL